MYIFTYLQVLVGLGATLLSDEKRALGKSSYRPINNLRKVMATLVIQRALKRNLTLKKGKSTGRVHMCDVVIAAENKVDSRRTSPTRNQLSPRVEGYSPIEPGGGISRLQPGYRDRVIEAENVMRPRTAARGVGALGSIGLPPGEEESAWLMRRFLVDLQQMNEEDDSIEQVRPTGGVVRKASTVAAAGGPEPAALNLLARSDGGSGNSDDGVGVGPLAQGRDVITADVAEAKHNQDTVASSSPAIPVSYTHLTLPTIYSV